MSGVNKLSWEKYRDRHTYYEYMITEKSLKCRAWSKIHQSVQNASMQFVIYVTGASFMTVRMLFLIRHSVIVNWTACYCNFMVDLVPWLKAKDKQV